MGPIPMPLSHGATHRKGAQVAGDVITFCVVGFDAVVVVVAGKVGTENIRIGMNKFAANQIDTMHARIQNPPPRGGGGCSDCDSSFSRGGGV